MIKNPLLVLTCCFILSCGSNESTSDSGTGSSNEKNSSGKYGDWELDNEGNKYREDYELRDLLKGNELVKYTRVNGGQFGGGTSTTKFTLCSDGTERYYHQSLTTVSVDGAGGSDASQDEDDGTWKAVESEDGVKLIMVISNKSNTKGFMGVKFIDDSKVQLLWYNEWQEFFIKKTDC